MVSRFFIIIWPLFLFPVLAFCADVSQEKTILTIQINSSSNVNNSSDIQLTLNDLKQLPQIEMKTSTRWTEGIQLFKGPLLRDVLGLTKANNQSITITVTAINGYSIDIIPIDFLEYDTILAISQNNELLTLRKKGPIRIIFPWTEKPELEVGAYYAKAVWQLDKIIIHD